MRKNFKTLNEQIDRIKQLFSEEMLYGNLVNEGLLTEGGIGKFLVKNWDEIGSVLLKKGIKLTDDMVEQFKNAPTKSIDDLTTHLRNNKVIWDILIKPPNNLDAVLDTLNIAKSQGKDFNMFSKIPESEEFWYEVLPLQGNFRVNALEGYRNDIGDKRFNEFLNKSEVEYKHPDKVENPVEDIVNVVRGLDEEQLQELSETFRKGDHVRLAGSMDEKTPVTGAMSDSTKGIKDPTLLKKSAYWLRQHFYFLDSKSKIKEYIAMNNSFTKAGYEPGKSWLRRFRYRYMQYVKQVSGVGAATLAYSWFATDPDPSINPVNWYLEVVTYPIFGLPADIYNLLPDSAKENQREANDYWLKEHTKKNTEEWVEYLNGTITNFLIPLLEDPSGGIQCDKIQAKVDAISDGQLKEAITKGIKEEVGTGVLADGVEMGVKVLNMLGGIDFVVEKVKVNSQKLVKDLQDKHCKNVPSLSDGVVPEFDPFDENENGNGNGGENENGNGGENENGNGGENENGNGGENKYQKIDLN